MSAYSSPYGGYGGVGGMYGGGYGGGIGMGYGGGMGGYGMPPMFNNDPNNSSLTQTMESTTQQTFALLQAIVQTFGGFAQMLESTFMATHSSFFAMVGVAEQLGQLRHALGTVLGLFGLVRWVREMLTGRRPADASLRHEFKAFVQRPPGAAPPIPGQAPSRKPLIFFLIAVLGVPYAMHRLIKSMAARLPPTAAGVGPNGTIVDPSQLSFARAVHAFAAKDHVELPLQQGDIVAILSTVSDANSGTEGEWWRGRTRDGREGWFPRAFVEVIKPAGPVQVVAPPASLPKEPKQVD